MKNFDRFKQKLKKDLQQKQEKNNKKFSTKTKLNPKTKDIGKTKQTRLLLLPRDNGL